MAYAPQTVKTEDSLCRPLNSTPSSNDLRKLIKKLERIISEQKEKRENVQQQFTDFKRRAVKRQSEYFQLIKKLKQCNSNIIEEHPEINKLFQTIWDNFDEFNRRSLILLEQSYSQNLQSMDRKMNSIIQTMKVQLNRLVKAPNVQLEKMRNDLKDIFEIAQNIEDKNIQMVKQVKSLQFQINLLKEERNIAIEDIMERKQAFSMLKKQNKQLHCQMAELNMQPQALRKTKKSVQSKDTKPSQLCYSTLDIRRSRAPSTTSQRKHLNKHKSQAQTFQSTLQSGAMMMQIYQQRSDPKSNYLNSTISFTPKSGQNIAVNPKNIKNGNLYLGRAKPIVSTSQKQNSKILQSKSKFVTKKDSEPSCNVNCEKCCQVAKEHKMKQYHYASTIESLQNTIKRQKQKSIRLIGEVNQMKNKDQQINEAIESVIKEVQSSASGETTESQNQRTKIISALLQNMKVIKQRLCAVEVPCVSAGWGDSLVQLC